MIAAGLDGVEKGLELGRAGRGDRSSRWTRRRSRPRAIKELPGTLGEALDELEKDDVIREALGDHVFSHFVEAKRAEWDEYRTQVSDWEVERYLDSSSGEPQDTGGPRPAVLIPGGQTPPIRGSGSRPLLPDRSPAPTRAATGRSGRTVIAEAGSPRHAR